MDTSTSLFTRCLQPRVIRALADTPVVLVSGPRQAGKTTLVRAVAGERCRYLTLDDEVTRLSALQDPVGMIRSLDRAVIDEIQRAPQLLLAIKRSVDEDRRPGRFLLTGSANLMALPTVADSLAGRMETLTLLPLSQSEIHGSEFNWIDRVVNGQLPYTAPRSGDASLAESVLCGGYPEAVSRQDSRRRTAWARQYLQAIIQRDVRDVADIARLDQLPRFLRALAQLSSQLCNYSQLGAGVGLDHKTAARYVGVFEQMYLLRRIEVWARNRLKRVIKTPKMHFIDSGLLAALTGATVASVTQDRSRFGSLLETFVYGELLKHAATADCEAQILYYRDHDQNEVDFVIETATGEVVGVEVKASASVRECDLGGLRKLASVAGRQFHSGVLLYDGIETLPLGDGIWAAPLATLWGQPTHVNC